MFYCVFRRKRARYLVWIYLAISSIKDISLTEGTAINCTLLEYDTLWTVNIWF